MVITNKKASIEYMNQITELENILYPNNLENIKNKDYINHPTFSVFTVIDEHRVKAFLLSKLVTTNAYEQFRDEIINEETLLNNIPNKNDEICMYFVSIYSSVPNKTKELVINTLKYFKNYNIKFAFSYAVTKKGILFSKKYKTKLVKDKFLGEFKLFYWTKDKLNIEFWQK